MYNTHILRTTFASAGESNPVRVKGASIAAQVDGAATVELFVSNFPDQPGSWQSIGTCSGFTPLEASTSMLYLKAAASGFCRVSVSCSSDAVGDDGGGGGGGTTGGLTNTELRASPVPVSASALPLPTGAASEATLSAASAKLPDSLGAKAGAASLSVTPATDALEVVGVIASNGVRIPVDSLAKTLGYTAGVLTTITVSHGGTTYVQTLTYTSGNLTGVSQWVAQ